MRVCDKSPGRQGERICVRNETYLHANQQWQLHTPVAMIAWLAMSKKPWGTITHPKERNPNHLMGFQTLGSEEIAKQVQRLYVPDWSNRVKDKLRPPSRRAKVEPLDMNDDEIDRMVVRLTRGASDKATDQNRTGSMKEQGVVNTYMWKGWNWPRSSACGDEAEERAVFCGFELTSGVIFPLLFQGQKLGHRSGNTSNLCTSDFGIGRCECVVRFTYLWLIAF